MYPLFCKKNLIFFHSCSGVNWNFYFTRRFCFLTWKWKQISGSGRLKFNDFKDLMCSLKYWQGAFKNHSKEKAGILKAEILRDALYEVGKREKNKPKYSERWRGCIVLMTLYAFFCCPIQVSKWTRTFYLYWFFGTCEKMEHYDSAILYRPFYISAMLLVI